PSSGAAAVRRGHADVLPRRRARSWSDAALHAAALRGAVISLSRAHAAGDGARPPCATARAEREGKSEEAGRVSACDRSLRRIAAHRIVQPDPCSPDEGLDAYRTGIDLARGAELAVAGIGAQRDLALTGETAHDAVLERTGEIVRFVHRPELG